MNYVYDFDTATAINVRGIYPITWFIQFYLSHLATLNLWWHWIFVDFAMAIYREKYNDSIANSLVSYQHVYYFSHVQSTCDKIFLGVLYSE